MSTTDASVTFDSNSGHNFWTNSSHTESIYFPASGFRAALNAILNAVSTSGNYWAADPSDVNDGCSMGFQKNSVTPLYHNTRTFGFAVRPVAEK